jgi:hypothetical protein
MKDLSQNIGLIPSKNEKDSKVQARLPLKYT